MKTEKQQFPNNSRVIPGKSFFLPKLFSVILLSILFVTIVIVGFDLLDNVEKGLLLRNQRKELVLEINYWKDFAAKHKDYRDGYFQLALLEYRLNNKEKAVAYLQDVLKIDPNFKEGRRLQQILSGNSELRL